ncbi:siderophore-interacting protein [Kribbella sp. GL6]|uniref:siderophore-interacting protein n=1 Tax=Kribbella sp. GL6 TaxID=3419765 RepID=UPI003CFE86BF
MTAVVLATVVAVRELSPSFRRVTLSGCAGLETGGYDQRIKILLARPGQDEPLLPPADDWYGVFCAMPLDVRPVMRTFTIRAQRGDLLDIEFALHGDTGPASVWARAARPGSVLGIIGPQPGDQKTLLYSPTDADWQLLAGDDTALPALTTIIESLPAGTTARAYVQVPDAGDVRDFDTAADLEVTWTIGAGLANAVGDSKFPGGTAYAWIAAETALVRDLRRYLTKDLGWPSKPHYFGGYWQAGQVGG